MNTSKNVSPVPTATLMRSNTAQRHVSPLAGQVALPKGGLPPKSSTKEPSQSGTTTTESAAETQLLKVEVERLMAEVASLTRANEGLQRTSSATEALQSISEKFFALSVSLEQTTAISQTTSANLLKIEEDTRATLERANRQLMDQLQDALLEQDRLCKEHEAALECGKTLQQRLDAQSNEHIDTMAKFTAEMEGLSHNTTVMTEQLMDRDKAVAQLTVQLAQAHERLIIEKALFEGKDQEIIRLNSDMAVRDCRHEHVVEKLNATHLAQISEWKEKLVALTAELDAKIDRVASLERSLREKEAALVAATASTQGALKKGGVASSSSATEIKAATAKYVAEIAHLKQKLTLAEEEAAAKDSAATDAWQLVSKQEEEIVRLKDQLATVGSDRRSGSSTSSAGMSSGSADKEPSPTATDIAPPLADQGASAVNRKKRLDSARQQRKVAFAGPTDEQTDAVQANDAAVTECLSKQPIEAKFTELENFHSLVRTRQSKGQ